MTEISRRRRLAIDAARACIGTPFRHQGRLPGVGLDCVGLIRHVADALGLPAYDYTAYGRRPHHGQLERRLSAAGLKNAGMVSHLSGDVLLFKIGAAPQHVALASDAGMIHAYIAARRVVEHRLDTAWLDRLVTVYRFPDMEA